MRNKILSAVCLAFFLAASSPAGAEPSRDPGSIAADALLARPLCLAATIVGSVVFVVSLPAAIPSKSVDAAADALVAYPAWATFKRPLGDFGSLAATAPSEASKTRYAHGNSRTLRSPKG